MVITLAGVGVASQLAQRSQDVRSDASTNRVQMGEIVNLCDGLAENTTKCEKGRDVRCSLVGYALQWTPTNNPCRTVQTPGIANNCRQQQVAYLYVRTTSNNGETWNDWEGPNYAVTAGSGLITGFSAWTDVFAVTKQHAVRGGELWVRSLDRLGRWSDWTQTSDELYNRGTGSLTSFSSHFFNFPAPNVNGKVRQYAVKGGQLWVRTSTSDVTREPIVFNEWAGPNGAVDGVGKGVLTGFSSYEGFQTGRYENKQYAVKGGQLFVRTSSDNVRWSEWSEPNPAADSAGPGTLTHFATIIEVSELKQYAVKESTIEVCAR
jgi:hypothetical protein